LIHSQAWCIEVYLAGKNEACRGALLNKRKTTVIKLYLNIYIFGVIQQGWMPYIVF
jgi:hypothetical protein